MSSKFNQRPVRRRRPPICIAPPGSCLPPFDPRTPPNISGLVQWIDLDPLGWQQAKGIVVCGPRSGTGLYQGTIAIGDVILGAKVQDNWPTGSVDVQITYWDILWGQLSHSFPTVNMPIGEPFNTRHLTTIIIPGTDYRKAYFVA